MDTIIGLGSAGCNIASIFEKYNVYSVYKIDVGLSGENCFDFPEQKSPEAYEANCPDMGAFLQNVSGDVLFIVAGGGQISGASLKILKQIKHCNISILYIKPDSKDLNNTGYLQNKLTYNVFQEYARSGIFKMIYIVSNKALEEIIGDVPIMEHDKKINEYIAGIFHYINQFSDTTPVINTYDPPKETARIATFGVYDMEEDEQDLFELKHLTDKCYYFAINEKTLKTDGKLLKKIKEHTSKNDVRASYEIHATNYENCFCYYLSFSNVVQPLDN